MNKKILDATATCAFCICLAVAPNIQEKRVKEAGAFGSICTGGSGVEDDGLSIRTGGAADGTLLAGATRVFSGYSFTTESDEKTGISRNDITRVTASAGMMPDGAAEENLSAAGSPDVNVTAAIGMPEAAEVPAAAIGMPEAEEVPAAAIGMPETAETVQAAEVTQAPELVCGPELLEGAPQQFYQNRWGITTLTDEEKELLARILWLEARGEPESGREAVVEVIFNRVASVSFPGTVYDVLSQKNPVQFSSWKDRGKAAPGEAEYQTIENVLNGNTAILRNDTLYFSRSPLTSRVDARIGAHSFCY